jgi:phosphate transport system substrate-binding protein
MDSCLSARYLEPRRMKNPSPRQRKPRYDVRRVAAFVSFVSFAGALTAAPALVDPGLPSYQPQPTSPAKGARYVLPDGSIRIVGAEHVETIVKGFNALFVRSYPAARFTLQLKGTTTAMPALTHGTTLFAPMGREVNGVELVPYEKIVGQEPVEIRVAHAAINSQKLATSLAVYVNKANPVERLTAEQVARIFATGHAKGDITHWGQVGLKEAWSLRAIHPYGTPEHTGFGAYMQKHQVGGLPFGPGLEPYSNTADILKRVSEDPAGIGIAATGRVTPQLKIVAIAGKDGDSYSSGTAEDVVAGKYPYGRYLYFYVRREPKQPIDPFVKEYMRLVLSADGQKIIASEPDGYLPLNAREAAKELAKLD